MRFRVSHITKYVYSTPASESFAELRVWPQDTETQRVIKRSISIEPATQINHYTDYYGNKVEFFSIPHRHSSVSVKASAELETFAPVVPETILATPVAEARQIYRGQLFRLFEFIQSSPLTPFVAVRRFHKRFFSNTTPLGEALLALNSWIYQTFAYTPGVTDVSTPLATVVQSKKGVCQDFAHLMLAILRSNGIPARYVSGYIEAYDPEVTDDALIGAAASHAWVEVYLPGDIWWGLDPTNNKPADERHVKVAAGRDYFDVAPMRGTYKGAVDQRLQVMVSLKRRKSSEALKSTTPAITPQLHAPTALTL